MRVANGCHVTCLAGSWIAAQTCSTGACTVTWSVIPTMNDAPCLRGIRFPRSMTCLLANHKHAARDGHRADALAAALPGPDSHATGLGECEGHGRGGGPGAAT